MVRLGVAPSSTQVGAHVQGVPKGEAVRILILNGFGNNLGDQAIMRGTLRLFEGHTLSQAFVYDAVWTEETIDRINVEFDLVVVGGGGLVYHRPWDERRTGWGLDLPAELLPRLTTPIALFSAGYNYRAFVEPHFPPHMARHFRAFGDHARHVSARDHESAKRLGRIAERPLDIVPDLAIHVDPVPVNLGGPTIAVSLRLDHPGDRFAPPAPRTMERFVRGLVAELEPFALTHQIVYAPHIMQAPDRAVGRILRERLGALSLPDLIPELYSRADPGRMPILYGFYQACDAVVGSRNHAVIIPWSVGTPVVSIASTESARWLQAMHGRADFHLGSHEEVGTLSAVLGVALTSKEELGPVGVARCTELREMAYERTAEMLEGIG